MNRLTTPTTLLAAIGFALVLVACGGNTRGRGGGDDPPAMEDAGPCVPMCEGLNCGPDGCGGSCGPCQGICVEGICGPGEGCVPSCDERECGGDGCGGSCGECESIPGASCNNGQCETECQPRCEGECGSDGCGGTCGTCEGDSQCIDGECRASAGGACSSGDCSCACERAEGICGADPSAILGVDCFTGCSDLNASATSYLFDCTNATDSCETLLTCAQDALAMSEGGGGGGESCTETCTYSNDGDCDDGGPGSDFDYCDLGTDCMDCGAR